jgi:HSP20 family protein
MIHGLAERDKSRSYSERIEITTEEVLSQQYIRFQPSGLWKPDINIYETDAALIICVDIAGMKPQAIRVEVEGRLLVLCGERPRPVPEQCGGMGVHLMEIDTGPFRREIEIPEAVDRRKIAAKYCDGLLWVTLPKTG